MDNDELIALVQELQKKIQELEERIEVLETPKKTQDKSLEDKKVMEFRILQNQGYFIANINISGNQARVYLGKKLPDDAAIKKKIVTWFSKHSWEKKTFLKAYPEYTSELEG